MEVATDNKLDKPSDGERKNVAKFFLDPTDKESLQNDEFRINFNSDHLENVIDED